ncbi:MAG TPA: undecaprenyldiphospho-muramoylpentapeptide beta-N-acetylglucosaminyltransferase [Solirubrobacteraceae bacterium]|nr:undecaprenyldiphospho-muramoylpentapeptide beta-N-acetylglucosaminyltransferase [Solirubrobacteraceae bacterium]
MSKKLNIVIAAGGTAGHVVPALAVAAALRADGAEVAFVGAGRAEAALVPQAGYELHAIAVEGLSRSNPLRALRALLRAALAVPRARALLRRLCPDAVMGGGGYVAGPVALAALMLRIPIVLTEADSRLGLTNRLLAPFARRVCLSFPIAGRDGRRYRVTGRPVPATSRDLQGARERLGIGAGETCVLVFGGSLGARTINRAAADAFAGRPSIGAIRVLHIAGSREYAELARRELPDGYDLREYLDEADFADALAAADLVVSRAGGSVFEIAAHGVPAILVPYPHASGDHQTTNARWMADAGAAVLIADGQLTGARLSRQVAELLADRSGLATMAAASRRLARPDAAQEIASELLQAAGG